MENTQEQEISLVGLFWKILFRWRQLIILGLIFAVFISGLQYVRSQSIWKKQQSGSSEAEDIELSQE